MKSQCWQYDERYPLQLFKLYNYIKLLNYLRWKVLAINLEMCLEYRLLQNLSGAVRAKTQNIKIKMSIIQSKLHIIAEVWYNT